MACRFSAWCEGRRVINTDKNPTYVSAIAALKRRGRLPEDVKHRQVKYLNNRIECDHDKIKRLIRPALGFQSMRTAYATLKGFEIMRMLKKGQFAHRYHARRPNEVAFINQLFDGYA